ncbi:MAG: hypothetical protein ACRC7B_00200 [Metamycoplasmataceae bacterium]
MTIKKIILGFGASLLTILPITTMIACSSTSDEKIDVEAEKFNNKTTTKRDIPSQEAVSSIMNASTPQEKRAALLDFANVPTLDTGFDYEVLSASIDNQVKSTVNVDIKVYEVSDENNSKNATYKVEGFASPNSNIEAEVAKLNVQVNTLRPELTAIQAMEMINSETPTEVFVLLKTLANIPTLSEGFSLTIKGATVNQNNNRIIDVSMTVSSLTTPEEMNAILRIAQFKVVNLDTESGKLDRIIGTTTPQTASETAVQSIQGANNALDKLEALRTFVTIPALDPGFDFEVLSASIDIQMRTTVDVEIKVFEKINQANFRQVTFKVAGFMTFLDIEARKFTSTQNTQPALNTLQALQLVNLKPLPQRVEEVRTFAELPTLENGFDYEVLQADLNMNSNLKIDVLIRVFQTNDQTNDKTITIEVTNFADLTRLELQLIKFNVTQLTINNTITSVDAVNQIIAAGVDQDAKKAALALLANVPTVDAPVFTYEVKDARVSDRDPNEIYVTITVTEDIWSEDVVFAINGFIPTP